MSASIAALIVKALSAYVGARIELRTCRSLQLWCHDAVGVMPDLRSLCGQDQHPRAEWRAGAHGADGVYRGRVGPLVQRWAVGLCLGWRLTSTILHSRVRKSGT